MENRNEKISVRSFVSLLMTFDFIALALSGICLYFSPQCSVAEKLGWKMLWLEKDQWSCIHMASAFLFLILAGFHLLIYNWKALISYMKPRAKRILSMRRELFYSLVAALVLFLGAALILPPFRFLSSFNDAIKMQYREKMKSGYNSAQNGLEMERGRGGGRGRK